MQEIKNIEFIKEQSKKIVELSEELLNDERHIKYQNHRYDELEKKYEAEKEYSKKLLLEFSRALEVIRGNKLEFNSEIIEAEIQEAKPIEFDGRQHRRFEYIGQLIAKTGVTSEKLAEIIESGCECE